MLLIPPYHRKKPLNEPTPSSTPPIGPPVLLAATYQVGTSVTLTFDRPVDVAESLPDAIVVRDGVNTGQAWIGNGMNHVSPTVVSVGLSTYEVEQDPILELFADASNGIRNANDGEVWNGATVELPFP